jgi:excinuclease ABC subunit B
MTVGRTEKPVSGKLPEKPDASKSTKRFSPLLEGQPERTPHGEEAQRAVSNHDVRPLVRGKTGVGSYEDPGEQKRKSRTKGKTGRPGR